MADNLELLDNHSLREKCMEYGLPNVPVTDSSRKVLIKRLRVSMGGGGDKTSKPRDSTPKKAAALNATTTEKVAPRKTPSRRTIAEAPLPKPDIIKPHVEKTSNVPRPIVERKQNNVLLFSDSNVQQEESRQFQRASSLTPSEKLAKSGVITTSYSQETAVLEDNYEDDDVVYITEPPPEVERNASRITPTYKQPVQGLAHGIGGFFKNTENPTYISKSVEINPITSPYGTTSGVKSAYLGQDRSYNRSSFGTFSQPKSDYNKMGLTRRYTEYTSVKDSGDDDDEVDEVQTPYLSSFARSLERLKTDEATKLSSSAPIRKHTSLIGQRRSYGYSGATATDDSISGAFRQFLIALDQKYQLKRAFALFLAFVLIVFIYVFFIM